MGLLRDRIERPTRNSTSHRGQRGLAPRGRLLLAVAAIGLFAGALSATACGGSRGDLPTAPTPPPDAIRDLTFLFLPAQGNAAPIASTNDVIQSGLIAAGYKVTTDPKDSYDAEILVGTTAT